MSNAVFTASESSIYDDLIESHYHFPATYRRQVEAAVGDWIVYYEPRRTKGPSSNAGRQAYFALGQVAGITPDPVRNDHFYAQIQHFLEFDRPVPFRDAGHYYEASLSKSDGSTNRGAFGRAVRTIPGHEFEQIVQAGFATEPAEWERVDQIAEPQSSYERPLVERIGRRPFRDAAFRRHICQLYDNTCALTGLRLINGGGRPEVQAAHIRAVENNGPDTVRNGIALTGTAHWLFDRGLVSIADDYSILVSGGGLPDELNRLIPRNRKLRVPESPAYRPHKSYLAWHREHRFKE